MNPPAVIETPESEKVSARVPWEDIRDDYAARLSLIARAREIKGEGGVLNTLRDKLRMIATASTPEAQEAFKAQLDDLLYTELDMHLDTTTAKTTIPEVAETQEKALEVVPEMKLPEVVGQEATPNQGYPNQRLTPQFPVPVLAEKDSAAASKKQFLDGMKEQLSQTRERTSQTVEIPDGSVPVDPPLTPSAGVSSWDSVAAPISAHEAAPAIPQEAPTPAPIVSNADSLSAVVSIPEEIVSPQTAEGMTVDLMSPEVTEGLQQLLAEWKDVFDKSGVFGFGAHGIDHPQYKRLAGLPMGVLSEKPHDIDQKILDSITEYIEGWQKEYGISPDPEEAFETYLRRVIAEILNRETKGNVV